MSDTRIPVTRRTVLAAATATAASLVLPKRAFGIARKAPLVSYRHGTVRGFVRNGASIFLGLPYGAPTGGSRRFLPPAPPASWSGIRDATRLGQRAPQVGAPIYDAPIIGEYMSGGRAKELDEFHEPMGEDCLVLNVLTPAADAERRPVLFYIHGGGYTHGSGATMTLSDRLVTEQDVVLVTVNHRLGILGFLYLGGLSPQFDVGNPGILDLVAALKWVRTNIAAFGGDPEKVTIFGESGGGAQVALLAAMPQARGLFRAAIIESGLLPTPFPRAVAAEASRALLDTLRLRPQQLDRLQKLPVEMLLPWQGRMIDSPVASPVADGRTLQADPWKTAPATAAQLPMIIGYCADGATLFYGLPDPHTFSLNWTSALETASISLKRAASTVKPVMQSYRNAYPAESASGVYFRMMTDATLGRQMVEMASLKATQSPPVFCYRMEYDTGIPPGLRAFHTCELPLVGRMVLQPRASQLSRQLAASWAAFARTGNPDHRALPHWRQLNTAVWDIMRFNETARFAPDPQATARAQLLRLLGSEKVSILGPVVKS